jgi:hypothetical protein
VHRVRPPGKVDDGEAGQQHQTRAHDAAVPSGVVLEAGLSCRSHEKVQVLLRPHFLQAYDVLHRVIAHACLPFETCGGVVTLWRPQCCMLLEPIPVPCHAP